MTQPVFALLPGSRASELEMHGELVLRTAEALHAVRPDARFLVPLATRPTRDRFEAAIYRLGLEKLPLTLLYGHATDRAPRGGCRRSSPREPRRSKRRSRAVRM